MHFLDNPSLRACLLWAVLAFDLDLKERLGHVTYATKDHIKRWLWVVKKQCRVS